MPARKQRDSGIYLSATDPRVARSVERLFLDGELLYDCTEADETFGWARCVATSDPTNRRQFLNEPDGSRLVPDGEGLETVVHLGKVRFTCAPELRAKALGRWSLEERRARFELAKREHETGGTA